MWCLTSIFVMLSCSWIPGIKPICSCSICFSFPLTIGLIVVIFYLKTLRPYSWVKLVCIFSFFFCSCWQVCYFDTIHYIKWEIFSLHLLEEFLWDWNDLFLELVCKTFGPEYFLCRKILKYLLDLNKELLLIFISFWVILVIFAQEFIFKFVGKKLLRTFLLFNLCCICLLVCSFFLHIYLCFFPPLS